MQKLKKKQQKLQFEPLLLMKTCFNG